MQALIKQASHQVIRQRFSTSAHLDPAVYASLVDYLQAHELLRFTLFDASTASVQVMLFADRLEVWNPGGLPPGLSVQSLHHWLRA